MITRTISLNRNSVCAADDVLGHQKFITVPPDIAPDDFIRKVLEVYLWECGKRKWIAYCGDTYPDQLGDKLFMVDTTFPCKVSVFSNWFDNQVIPDKIYFELECREKDLNDAEIKESFTLYQNGWLAKLFKIHNRR